MANRIRFLLVFLLCCQRAAADYVKLCTLRASVIIPVTFDEESDSFVAVATDGKNNTSGENRLLRSSDTTAAISVSTDHRVRQTNLTGKVFYVRQCKCSTRPRETEIKAYCPVDKSTCGIPRDVESEPIGCFNQSSRTSLIRNAWPVIILWYAGLLVFLMFTAQGRNARHYLIGKCCNRNFNHELIEQYWYIEGGFWQRRRRRPVIPSILQDVRQRAQTRQNEEVPPLPPNTLDHLVDTHSEHPPNQLALKTKRYVAPRNVQDEDDLCCTICFTPLEDGDRVGALQCNHSFHVDCLKEWLRRRNICPLCQAPDVAAPQYQSHGSEDEENSLIEQDEEEQSGGRDNQNDSQDSLNEQPGRETALTVTPQAEVPPGLHHRAIDVFRGRTILQHRR